MLQDMEFGGFRLTDKGWQVLRGRIPVRGRLDEEPAFVKFADAPPRSGDQEVNQPLFELLRRKRKILADKSGVPPYVIFSDKTLLEMAIFFPQSRASLLAIHGVGAVKCEKFGPAFLDVIKRYCRENQIEELPNST